MQVNNMTRIIIMLEIVKPHLNFINKMLVIIKATMKKEVH